MTEEKPTLSQLPPMSTVVMVNGMSDRDYYVTVCDACRCASCWHGEFLCQESLTAGTVDVLASVLRAEGREHPGCFSVEKLMEVCGSVRYAP